MPVTIVGNNTPTAGGVVYGDGTNYASTAAGTSGQFLQSAGAGTPVWATPSGGFSTAQVFTSSGTFTVPSSGKFKVTIVGGGGSGAKRNTTAGGSSGAGGGTAIKWYSGATPGATATITIGAGGASVTTADTYGNAGGTSSFALSGFSTLSAAGGNGGAFEGSYSSGGAASNGDINISGQNGGATFSDNANNQWILVSVGGSSMFGLGGVSFNNFPATNDAATGYGSGGLGTLSYYNSNPGRGGICIVEY